MAWPVLLPKVSFPIKIIRTEKKEYANFFVVVVDSCEIKEYKLFVF